MQHLHDMADPRPHAIALYGATGFTGKLVAEALARRGCTSWALAGRNLEKLAQLRDELGLATDVPLLQADAGEPTSLEGLCKQAQLVVTTVGPYQIHGSGLVEACARTGTDYMDLNGEPVWMKEMIAAHSEAAKQSGARILFSTGFDSLPSDLGVWFLQQAALKQFGQPLPRIKGRVRRMKGDASGGTMASMKATLKATIKDPESRRALGDPFALTPGFVGPQQPAGMVPEFNQAEGFWEVPFAMAAINTKNVHRTNYLLGFPYGKDFVYDEMMFTTIKDAAMAAADVLKNLSMFGGKSHKKGEGPSKEERENGYYELAFYGSFPDGRTLTASVAGDADPGYGSTSKMMAETALCLAALPRETGGCFTSAALMPESLIAALQAHAGITFRMEG